MLIFPFSVFVFCLYLTVVLFIRFPDPPFSSCRSPSPAGRSHDNHLPSSAPFRTRLISRESSALSTSLSHQAGLASIGLKGPGSVYISPGSVRSYTFLSIYDAIFVVKAVICVRFGPKQGCCTQLFEKSVYSWPESRVNIHKMLSKPLILSSCRGIFVYAPASSAEYYTMLPTIEKGTLRLLR